MFKIFQNMKFPRLNIKKLTFLLKIPKIILKRFLNALLLLIPIFVLVLFWLIFSESGLKALVYSVQPLIPGTLTIGKVSGTLHKTISLERIDYQNQSTILKAEKIIINGDWLSLLQKNLKLHDFQIENAEYLSTSNNASSNNLTPNKILKISKGQAKAQAFNNGNIADLYIQTLQGEYDEQPFQIKGGVSFVNGLLTFRSSNLEWGPHKISIHPGDVESKTVFWQYKGPFQSTPHSTSKPTTNGSRRIFSEKMEAYGKAITVPGFLSIDSTYVTLGKKKILSLSGTVSVPKVVSQLHQKIVWSEQPLQGNFQIALLDLSPIYHLVPVISRLKATPVLKGEIKGSITKPVVTLHGDVGTAMFSIPKQRMTIKDFHLRIGGTWGQDLALISSGSSGGNYFHIYGNWNPFKTGMPGEFQLTGKELRIFNTANIRIVASPKLVLKSLGKKIFIQGKVEVVEGEIVLKKELNSVIVSNDIVYLGQNNEELHPESIQILPEIELIIQDNVHFKGYGLDTHVKGKLYIEQRKDRMYTGEGRIVLREGKYRLPNGTGNIGRGYLYYPPGTLLHDPVLDIRVLQRARDKLNESGDVGVYVQGSLQKPVYQLYSSEPLKQNEILSKLGFGGTQFEGEDNQRQMLSQTAVLLGGGANPLLENIQAKFGLEEFGIQSGNASKYIATQEGNDAQLVVGKALTERLYLQFMQGMLVPSSTLKLQYFITPYVAVSGETSTTGLGADLSFSVERD